MLTQVKFPVVIDGVPQFWAEPFEAEHFARLQTVRPLLRRIGDYAEATWYAKATERERPYELVGELILVLVPTIERVICLGDLGPPVQNELNRRYEPPIPQDPPEVRKTICAPTVRSIRGRGALNPGSRGLSVRRRKSEAQSWR